MFIQKMCSCSPIFSPSHFLGQFLTHIHNKSAAEDQSDIELAQAVGIFQVFTWQFDSKIQLFQIRRRGLLGGWAPSTNNHDDRCCPQELGLRDPFQMPMNMAYKWG